ncbi:MAG: GNAT family N-acetyltransferase [Aeromicrobium sp.]
MIFSAPDPAADPHVVAMVLALQRASYAVEAQLIGDDRIPPLADDEHAISAWRGRWGVAWDGTDLVGAIAWADHDDHLDLHRVMVSPSAMRQGIASDLLRRVLHARPGRRVVVTTGRDNAPGVSFYAKHGFAPVGEEHVPPGIWVTRLELDRGRS